MQVLFAGQDIDKSDAAQMMACAMAYYKVARPGLFLPYILSVKLGDALCNLVNNHGLKPIVL